MSDQNTNWENLITEEMANHGEVWGDVEHCTLDRDGLLVRFYSGFGGADGKPFTLWTKTRVYFPVVYDGAEWVGSAPRNPCDEATRHQGGE